MTQQRTYIALRAARATLGWTQQELAKRAGVALISITRLEAGAGSPRLTTIDALKSAMQTAGVTIIDNQPLGGFTLLVSNEAITHDVTSEK